MFENINQITNEVNKQNKFAPKLIDIVYDVPINIKVIDTKV